jgi:hypothetical protein
MAGRHEIYDFTKVYPNDLHRDEVLSAIYRTPSSLNFLTSELNNFEITNRNREKFLVVFSFSFPRPLLSFCGEWYVGGRRRW